MDLDLHIHSTASDGFLSPAEVVEAAIDARLDVIALTDHDTVAGVPPAIEAAAGRSLEVVAALEVSTTLGDQEFHILGYFVDPFDERLLAHTAEASRRRKSRMEGMLGRLREQGIDLSFEAVARRASEDGSLGRPHLAHAMVEAGYVESAPKAFELYIGNEHPAYLPTRLLEPEEAIRMIRSAGGVSVWAHPPVDRLPELLPLLVKAGLEGLEVYRPRMSSGRMVRLEEAARRAGLLVSGGSDWHGPEHGRLGEFRVKSPEVAGLLSAGGL